MKNEIVAKRFGKNLVVVINDEKKTRVISTENDKEEEKIIKNKITLYNKKNNKILLDEILYLVDTKKRENEALEATKKGIKKSIKKEVKKTSTKVEKEVAKSTSDLIKEIGNKKLTAEDTAALESLLRKGKLNKAQTATTSSTTNTPRAGER